MTAPTPEAPERVTLFFESEDVGRWVQCTEPDICTAPTPHHVYIRETPLTKAAGEMLEALEEWAEESQAGPLSSLGLLIASAKGEQQEVLPLVEITALRGKP